MGSVSKSEGKRKEVTYGVAVKMKVELLVPLRTERVPLRLGRFAPVNLANVRVLVQQPSLLASVEYKKRVLSENKPPLLLQIIRLTDLCRLSRQI